MSQGNLDEAQDIILLGDGRMDSPGFCAKFCKYVGMCDDTHRILALEVIDRRETKLKSKNMEKEGLVRSINSITKAGVLIEEIVTDAQSQIITFMRELHPEKKH